MNDAAIWTGSSNHQISLRTHAALWVDHVDEGWFWCVTEPWKLGHIPDETDPRRFFVEGLCPTLDEAKAAAEAVAARVLADGAPCQ